jgi:LysM repeat protein
MRQVLFVAVAAILAVVLLTAAQPSPVSAAGPAYYVVRPGDTLTAIAWRYGMTTWAIARANGIWNPNYIYAGQVLVIPYVPGPFPPVPPYPPGPIPGPIYQCAVRVNYGDTLIAIAARLRTDVWTLARANGIYNLNWIYAGQWLRIPGCSPYPVPVPPSPVPQRRNISGTWLSGNYSFQLQEALGCPGPNCAVTGKFIEAHGTTTPDMTDVTGSVNVNSGAVSITIPGNMPGAPTRYFNGTIDAYSRTMTGQLTGVGALTFTKQ